MPKVKYGLCDCHYASVTETVSTSTGATTTTYGTVKPWPGSVNLSLSNSAEKSIFRADNTDWYVSMGEGKIEGDFESAVIPDDIEDSVFNYVTDDNGVVFENSDSFKTTKYIAFGFRFENDVKAVKHWLYKVSLSRPNLESATTPEGGTVEPKTDTVTLTAVPRPDDGLLHAKTRPTTDADVYAGWFSTVYVPTVTPPEPNPNPNQGEGV